MLDVRVTIRRKPCWPPRGRTPPRLSSGYTGKHTL